MPVEFLIVDGYNLLYAAGLGRDDYGPRQFEACRRRLLLGLADRLDVEQRKRTTVVFDAVDAPPDVDPHQRFAGIDIVFVHGGDADSLIEAMINEHSAHKQLKIVSSDHRLQNAARRRGSRFVDSDVFWDSFAQAGEGAGAGRRKRGRLEEQKYGEREVTSGEAEVWMDEMGVDGDSEVLPEPADDTSPPPEVDRTFEELIERGEEALREAADNGDHPSLDGPTGSADNQDEELK